MSSATLADGSRNTVHTLVRRYSSRQKDVARLSARSLSLSEEALLWTVFHHYTIRGAGEVSNTMHMSSQVGQCTGYYISNIVGDIVHALNTMLKYLFIPLGMLFVLDYVLNG